MNPINGFTHNRYHNYAGRTAYSQRRESEIVNKNAYNDLFNKTEESNNKVNTPLSKKAQSVLDALTAKYGNMDFYVQDFSNASEAKEIMSGSTREFSVLLSPDELEKMANDKAYMQEKMDAIDGAMAASERINSQFGYTSDDKNAFVKSDLARLGISFDSNGKMTIFADLERTVKDDSKSDSSRPYQNKSSKTKYTTKKTTISASTTEELLQKLKGFSWKDVAAASNEKDDTGFSWNFDA